ncbi:MAG: YggT family protein [Candidatus Omnitrophica bacterium]|nr:YggT family protein [Candidatus Omnitrophota bacterium]
MFVIGNLFTAVAQILDFVLVILMWMVIIRALLSWVNPDPYNPIVQFLYGVTEPMMSPFRRYLPMTGIDFSPILVLLVIMFSRWFIVRTLFDLGMRMS